MSDPEQPQTTDEITLAAVADLVALAFGDAAPSIASLTDVNRGRGAFSVVVRAELSWATGADRGPSSVVAKLPMPGPNGRAARDAGAYGREALAYRQVLPRSPIGHPVCHALVEDDDAGASFLLEDLTPQRQPDQLDGLGDADTLAVAEALAGFHRAWERPDELATLTVRRNTLAGLAPEALRAGLVALAERWSDEVDPDQRAAFDALVVAQPGLVDRFNEAPATLCHGDPRADNLAIDHSGRPILFDWQQMAVQFGEADLAWLAATSLTIHARRRIERDLVAAGDGDLDRYRLGLALPGLAVLLLAQRDFPTERARRFVATSLRRIAAAITDNDTATLAA